MQARLYAIPAFNAAMTAQLALERKQIPFHRVDQLPVLHRIAMRVRGFEGTVPGVVDGRKVHGSSTILRALDNLVPEPRLYPTDPAGRAAVAEAVSWGERVYQRNELISQGVLNADEPGAADLKIAPTTRALPVVGGSPPAARAA